ncbi:MAG: hypothetical protein ACLRNP_02765 [Blautia coccoides]
MVLYVIQVERYPICLTGNAASDLQSSERKQYMDFRKHLIRITPNFGLDEAMSWIYDDIKAEAVWVYGMGQGSAADAADLIECLNAPADGDVTNKRWRRLGRSACSQWASETLWCNTF